MAYSELLKDFERIRDYMRDFYVYGFKSRSEYNSKSIRSYDNERRRVESWLGDYMEFQQTANGRCVFLSVDSRSVPRNPLYKAFKAKSFTDNDILFHFCVLDFLRNTESASLTEITQGVDETYLSNIPDYPVLDESTIRKKLKEYVELGIITCEKKGGRVFYSYNHHDFDLSSWQDCLSFFSEENPLGVIGTYLQGDKEEQFEQPFRFKHNYILTALDSEVMYKLVTAISEKRRVEIDVWSRKNGKLLKHDVCPARIYISTQAGRQYVLVTQAGNDRPQFYRMDLIKSVKYEREEPDFDKLQEWCDSYRSHLWGVSGNKDLHLEHFEMDVHILSDEHYILARLYREKRIGTIERKTSDLWTFKVDVYDAMELLPWIRTFTGRIARLFCTNHKIVETYYHDLTEMKRIYTEGG